MRVAGLLVAVTAVAACAETSDDPRHAWVIARLADDNRLLALREPRLVAGKLRKMQRRFYDWFRGTTALYWRDLTEPGPWAWPTAFGDGPSSRLLVLGDPHLENLGTFRPASAEPGDGRIVVDWNDFDAAGYGPYWGDVRRLAVSLLVAAVDRVSELEARHQIASAVARGYAEEIERLAGGAEMTVVEQGTSVVFDVLLQKGLEDGDSDVLLARYTRVDGLGQRYVLFADFKPVFDGIYDETVVHAGDDTYRVPDAVARWRTTLATSWPDDAFRIKGVGRRLGAGVASYPALRLYVLLEGPTPDVADDWLIEIKETGDGLRIAGLPDYGPGFASAGERAVFAQRSTAGLPDADELLGWVDQGPMSFRVRNRTGYQKGLDVDDVIDNLRDGVGGITDLSTFGAIAGRMLAQAHVRAPTADGDPALPIIADRLASPDPFIEETAAFAVAYAAQVFDDWALALDRDLFAELYP